jgi:hypothetical protein
MGYLFRLPFGFSFTALRVSTVVLSLLSASPILRFSLPLASAGPRKVSVAGERGSFHATLFVERFCIVSGA